MDVKWRTLNKQRKGIIALLFFSHREEKRNTYYTKHIVMGIGTRPHVPEKFQSALGDRVFHSAQYMGKRESILPTSSITVIGSGQSAAEIFFMIF
ncbi:hypothetical protein GCM10020331_090120 [Ectobacillus funiculus]